MDATNKSKCHYVTDAYVPLVGEYLRNRATSSDVVAGATQQVAVERRTQSIAVGGLPGECLREIHC
jgi:hypothetical protein